MARGAFEDNPLLPPVLPVGEPWATRPIGAVDAAAFGARQEHNNRGEDGYADPADEAPASGDPGPMVLDFDPLAAVDRLFVVTLPDVRNKRDLKASTDKITGTDADVLLSLEARFDDAGVTAVALPPPEFGVALQVGVIDAVIFETREKLDHFAVLFDFETKVFTFDVGRPGGGRGSRNDGDGGDRGPPPGEVLRSTGTDPDLAGAAGDDTLIGNGLGPDRLNGRGGDDVIYDIDGPRRDSDDALIGHRGDDVLFGADGDDRLRGGHGRDSLAGGRGSDTLHGGNGSDFLHGDLTAGSPDYLWFSRDEIDHLHGGRGRDVFAPAFNTQVIHDWEDGIDQILVDARFGGRDIVRQRGEDAHVIHVREDGVRFKLFIVKEATGELDHSDLVDVFGRATSFYDELLDGFDPIFF